jgi:nucleotide-binding universal stress UspA family protein
MIICGTDLSVASEAALQAAAALARKQNLELLLVNVREDAGSKDAGSSAELQLERDAAHLRRSFDISVETAVVSGIPEQKLLELAKQRSAGLIVVAARGGARHTRRLGSVPEFLCQRAEVPVLVARNPEALLAFSKGARPLQVLVGSGLGDASRSALEYIAAWPDVNVTVAHVAWPFGEHYRLGVGAPMTLDHLRPEIHRQLLGDLGRWTAETPSIKHAKLDVSPGFGRIDCHLAQLATEKSADLLVVGSHQRNVASRVWQGSVSRGVIHEANCNVLCVPRRYGKPHAAPAPSTVLIPTDFSPLADRAVAYGYGLIPAGGSVHLVHVVGSFAEANATTLRTQLSERVPADAEARGIRTELQVLEGDAPWLAIWQYAGRSNADMICMATHSRGAAQRLVLGSQTQAILQHSRVPVLLVPPDRET